MQSINNSSSSHILNGCESVEDLSGSGTNAKDLPIDPLWEKQQKKTFTAWCNAHLRKVNIQIEDIGEDFRDGLKLMRLLEVISNESLPKPEKGKLRLHHVNNVNKALNFIVNKGVKLVSVGAEEIVDGNIKMTLGMIWTVILRFAIQNISYEDISAKEGLLLWCQRQTKGYQNVNVLNFHHSFKDGLAFCALIHKHRPELIDYAQLKQSNHSANLNLAFDVAEERLDIPRMLDAEDMVTPDEKSVMAYVSSYYHCFSTGRQLGVAATRISKAVSVHRENQALKEEYEMLSKELIDWISRKTVDFQVLLLNNQHEFCVQCTEEKDDMSEVQLLMDAMRNYRKSEKPQKLEDKAKLESNYNTLQTRLRLSGRQPFIPSEHYTIVRIEALWKVLETTEHSYELWLERELTRLKNMNHLLNKFYVKVRSHEAWSHDKPVQLSDVEAILSSTQGELRAMTKRHEAFCSDLLARAARVHRITALCAELQSVS
ncbi:actinin alpha 2 [Cichlidogyrus casuarinus]|uniref:Actinin alpha 2 n=1 Tax=Cichlidogyrus casuarinus TaxID=1844966 RepID=A0ABD2Q0Z6_9PLAT